jgi:2-hydroxychromene-2-carboxylate isomerase
MAATSGAAQHVEFLFDFGSPNAYLCHKLLAQIEQRTGARFDYVPILLGGLFKLANNRSPVEAFAAIPNKMAYDRLEMQRFIKRHALTAFTMNLHFPVNTLQIMRAAVAAQHLGCFTRYVDTVFAAMWEHSLKMDDASVISATLDQAGLNAEQLMQTAQLQEIKAKLLANTQNAHDRGAFGSPTFFVDDEMYFGKDRLGDVEEAIARW